MENYPKPESHPVSLSEFEPLLFEKKEYKEGMMMYIFKDVVIGIDITGKNHPLFPELFFGVGRLEDMTEGNVFNKPKTKLQGVDMAYVVQCIRTAANDSGIQKFWFYPAGEDASPERKEERQLARVRLFSQFANIVPEENGFGYILEV